MTACPSSGLAVFGLSERTPMTLTNRFDDALVFARVLHAAQVRKGTTIPYVAHLLAVASIVLEHGGTEDEAMAALLHDAVEDQGGAPTLVEIRDRFGSAVAAIVAGCTDANTVPKPEWRARKEAYVAHIAGASASVRLVSAADKLRNARAIVSDHREIGSSVWSRFNVGPTDIRWYYRALTDAFTKAGETALTRELTRTVIELERAASDGVA